MVSIRYKLDTHHRDLTITASQPSTAHLLVKSVAIHFSTISFFAIRTTTSFISTKYLDEGLNIHRSYKGHSVQGYKLRLYLRTELGRKQASLQRLFRFNVYRYFLSQTGQLGRYYSKRIFTFER